METERKKAHSLGDRKCNVWFREIVRADISAAANLDILFSSDESVVGRYSEQR